MSLSGKQFALSSLSSLKFVLNIIISLPSFVQLLPCPLALVSPGFYLTPYQIDRFFSLIIIDTHTNINI